MKRIWRWAAAAAAVLAICACSRIPGKKETVREPEFVLTYAENQAEDYPTTRGAYKFAELVSERTNGRIEIMVNASASLGDERSVIEQMQYGGIDFARVSLSQLAGFVPELNVLQMPYLYKNSRHMWEVLDGEIGDRFLRAADSYGLVALSWYDAGVRNFYSSSKPIECLEDVRGMKIRVQQSGMMEELVKALGGYAMSTSYAEVYSALQTGEIEAAENNWPSYESERHFEVAPYYTVDEHNRIPEVQIASQVTWNKLSPEDQAVIRACAEESSMYERQLWGAREKEAEKRVRAAGCTVIELTDAEKKRFQEAAMPVYEKFCSDHMDTIEEIRAVGELLD